MFKISLISRHLWFFLHFLRLCCTITLHFSVDKMSSSTKKYASEAQRNIFCKKKRKERRRTTLEFTCLPNLLQLHVNTPGPLSTSEEFITTFFLCSLNREPKPFVHAQFLPPIQQYHVYLSPEMFTGSSQDPMCQNKERVDETLQEVIHPFWSKVEHIERTFLVLGAWYGSRLPVGQRRSAEVWRPRLQQESHRPHLLWGIRYCRQDYVPLANFRTVRSQLYRRCWRLDFNRRERRFVLVVLFVFLKLMRYQSKGKVVSGSRGPHEEVPMTFTSGRPGKMAYEDFCWFLIADEDKTTDRSLELSLLSLFSVLRKAICNIFFSGFYTDFLEALRSKCIS